MNARMQKCLAWGMALAVLAVTCYQVYGLWPKAYEKAFADILFNDGTFIDAYDGVDHSMTFSEFYEYGDEMGTTEDQKTFALLDLDDDGTPELILPLVIGPNRGYDNIVSYLILRYVEGEVLGYSVPFRGFYPLKTDGSFSSSGGALNHGIYSISEFSRETYSTKVYAQIRSYDVPGTPSGIGHICHVDGQAVDAETFDKATTEWDRKTDATFQKISKWNWWRSVLK